MRALHNVFDAQPLQEREGQLRGQAGEAVTAVPEGDEAALSVVEPPGIRRTSLVPAGVRLTRDARSAVGFECTELVGRASVLDESDTHRFMDLTQAAAITEFGHGDKTAECSAVPRPLTAIGPTTFGYLRPG